MNGSHVITKSLKIDVLTYALSFYRSQNVLCQYKIVCACTNILRRYRFFAPDQNLFYFQCPFKIFCAGTKSLGTAQYVHNFWSSTKAGPKPLIKQQRNKQDIEKQKSSPGSICIRIMTHSNSACNSNKFSAYCDCKEVRQNNKTLWIYSTLFTSLD